MKTGNKHDYIHTLSRILFFGGIFFVLFIFIKKISTVLTPFILSFIIAYLFSPVSIRMQHKFRLKKHTSAIIIVFFMQFFFIGILTIALPAIYNQGLAFFKTIPLILDLFESKILPSLPSSLVKLYHETGKNINIEGILNQTFVSNKENFLLKAYTSGVVIINIISTIFLVPILSFYMIRDWQKIHKSTLNLIPVHYKYEFEIIIHEIRKKVSAYVTGEIYAIFILSLLYGIGLSITGLKFGFFIGTLTAILSIIPYVGFAICVTIAVVIAFATNMLFSEIIAILAVFAVIQVFESNYIIPKLVGGKIGLHPLWIIFGLLAGGSLLGFIGLLLAIPITTIVSVLIKHYIKKYKNSEYYED